MGAPWESERNRYEFEYREFPCKIVRMEMLGHLCGYVRIPEWSRYYGKLDSDIDLNVHGGITASNIENKEHWIGFDCAHIFDYIPYYEDHNPEGATYKDVGFVAGQLLRLVDQIIEAGWR